MIACVQTTSSPLRFLLRGGGGGGGSVHRLFYEGAQKLEEVMNTIMNTEIMNTFPKTLVQDCSCFYNGTIIFLPPMFASLYFYSFPNPPPPLPHFHCWNIGNWACVKVTILNTISTVQVTLAYPDFASTRFRIHSVFKNFHSGERIQKVADSYTGFTGYVWTKAKTGEKK